MKKMKKMKMKKAVWLAAAVAALAHGAVRAAPYPEQPITLVVPFSAGGGADNAARILAKGLGEVSGQSVIVDNKPGASGSIGGAAVARARPDGYTVLFDASSFAINPALRKLPFDPARDLVAVSQIISVPNILVVAPSSPYNTLPDFLAAARAKPGKLTYASYGPGSLAQMAVELLRIDAKFDAVHVPYKGGAPAIMDVMGGQVDVYFANAASSLSYVKSGKLKALAVSSAARMKELPSVPTVQEAGIKGYQVMEWNGLFVPAGTPPAVIARLQELSQKALALPDVRSSLDALGLTPVGSSAAEFQNFVNAERKRWDTVVKTNGITAN